jgi:hypothetical protein
MTRMGATVAGVLMALLLSAWTCTGTALAFTDVPDGHRYARAIRELAQSGIVSGRADGTFGPDDPVNRAQFAKMMCGLLKIGVSEDQSFAPFVDLGPDNLGDLYPHEFVGAASQAGIVKGKTGTVFCPYADITLAQVITVVVRAADADQPGLLATPRADWWGWWPDTDPTHGANIRRADYTDLLARIPVEGPRTDIFRPATRGEVSQILVNLRGKLEGVSIAVTFEGDPLDSTCPIRVVNNRYYLPLAALAECMRGTLTIDGDVATIAVHSVSVSLDTARSHYTVSGTGSDLKQSAVIADGQIYVSLFDLQKMLNLAVDWDEETETINLFWSRGKPSEAMQPMGGRPALVRFEDVTSAQRYSSEDSLERLRIVFDYCYARGIPMQLGWVPRFVDPANGIDSAPAEDYSMHNADFVYTLDYFADRNGLVGLHGYTHQYGNGVSIYSTEFDEDHNTTESDISKRIRCALYDASALDIPVSFFESPHYSASPYQKSIIGQYFDTIYEYRLSGHEKNITRVTMGTRTVTYIPTPLGYVDGITVDTSAMIRRIRSLEAGELGSFFYHPDFESDFIALSRGDDGYPSYEYSADSPLHRIVDTFLAGGYTFVGIDSL